MTHEFLNRALPIFTETGIETLQRPCISFAGLGGVGGGAFLALVRCGVTHFRLAENGQFDPPDMNRQAGAFGTTMGLNKLDVYVELAKSINPDVRLELFPEGITPENIERFLDGADLHVGVIDVEKGAEVKAMTPELLRKFNVPMITCGAIGFGALLVAHEPNGMMPDEFWRRVGEKSKEAGLLPSYLGSHFDQPVMARIEEGVTKGIMPTTAIGGLSSNTLLACEVLTYLLKDSGLVDRKPVFAPQYTIVDFMNQTLIVGNVTTGAVPMSQEETSLSDTDMDNLRAALEVTREAVDAGLPPFGAVMAGPDGTILMRQENQTTQLNDHTKHAESVLASRFCQGYYADPEFRSQCTLYSSMEPCAMCMFNIFSAGIGRVVYGLSADHLYEIFNQYDTWPRIHLSSREAAGYMSRPMAVAGPYLEEEAAALVKKALENYDPQQSVLTKKEGE